MMCWILLKPALAVTVIDRDWLNDAPVVSCALTTRIWVPAEREGTYTSTIFKVVWYTLAPSMSTLAFCKALESFIPATIWTGRLTNDPSTGVHTVTEGLPDFSAHGGVMVVGMVPALHVAESKSDETVLRIK